MATEPAEVDSVVADFEVGIDHPGTTLDASTRLKTVLRAGVKNVAYAFDPSIHSLKHQQLKLQELQSAGSSASNNRTLAQTLCVIGQYFMTQQNKTSELIGGFTNYINKNTHMIGIVQDEHWAAYDFGGYSVDFPLIAGVGVRRIQGTSYDPSGFISEALMGSAFEQATIAQTQNGDKAASTVSLIAGSAVMPKLFEATPNNWNSIKSQLANYSASDLAVIEDAIINHEATVFLPISGKIQIQNWAGAGYLLKRETESTDYISALISGGYKGGYSGQQENVSPEQVSQVLMLLESLRNGTTQTGTAVTGGDPVNMNTGQFVQETTDLVIGNGVMPEGLSFVRRYDGGNRLFDSSKLGHGWTHSFDLKAQATSSPDLILRNGDAISRAAYVLGIYTLVDLVKNRGHVKDWALAMVAAHNTANLLVDNAVSVQLPDRVLQFNRVLIPGGYYPSTGFEPPPGCTAQLIRDYVYDTGPPGVPWVPAPIRTFYKLQERHGRLWTFAGTDGEFTEVSDQYGRKARLTSNSATNKTYTDCYGRSLVLNFNEGSDDLYSVDDPVGGRYVSFNKNTDAQNRRLLTAVVDPVFKQTRFQYDTLGRMTKVQDHLQNTVVHNTVFDSQHRVIEQMSRGDVNRTWRYYYSPGQTIEENPLGQQTVHLFDEQKRNVGTVDGMQRLFASVYDAQDRLVKARTPLGFENELFYNADHNPTTSKDALGHETVMTYDTAKRLQTTTDATGKTSTINLYNEFNLPTSITDAAGVTTTYTYVPSGQSGAGQVQTMRVNGVLKSRLTYNAKGLVETVRQGTDSVNKIVASYTYNPLGDVESVTDASGAVSLFYYNGKRQLNSKWLRTSATAPMVWFGSYTYSDAGDLDGVTNARGFKTTTRYNVVRKPYETVLPGGALLQMGYDLADRQVTTTNELNQTMTKLLNGAGQVRDVVDPLSRTVVMGYDGDGRPTTKTDPLLRLTRTDYNARGEVMGSVQADGNAVTQLYDDAGRRTHLTNRRGHSWVFGYDSGGRPSTVTTPELRVSQTHYDTQGRAWKSTEPSGQEMRLVLDAYDRVERTEFFAAAADMTPQEVVSHTYTANDQLHTTTEGSSVTTRSYHPDPRHLINTYTNAAGETFDYQFDLNSNLTRLTLPDGKQMNYVYDNRDRLTSITDWAGRVTSLVWDAASKLESVTRPNGTVRRTFYDGAGQLTRIEERTSAGRLIQMVRLGLDAVGRAEKRFTVPLPAAASFPPLSFTYTADNWITGRLYDQDGNLRQVPRVPAPIGQAALGALPGLLDVSGSDENATWDQRNRLMSLTLADSSTLAFTYDAENLRLTKTRGSQTTRYTQNPHGIMGMSEVDIEHLPDGSKRWYVWGGPAGLLYDVSVPAGGGTETLRYYHSDQVGSTLALTDGAGAVIGRADYTPYGLMTRRTGDTDTPFLYNGAFGVMTDAETGLVHMRARYYHPWMARFLNEDPSGFGGGLNMYAFADGNPVMLLDALGLDAHLGGFFSDTWNAMNSYTWNDLFDDGRSATAYMGRGTADLLQVAADVVNLPFTLTGSDPMALGPMIGGTEVAAVKSLSYAANYVRAATSFSRAARTIDPAAVRFTQDSIGATFKNGQSIDDVARALRGSGGEQLAGQFPPIRLVQHESQLFTLDNRRLATFSAGGQQVPYRMATPAEISAEWTRKFTTTAEQGWGQFITVRPPTP